MTTGSKKRDRKHLPLGVCVTRDGVLTVEIGIETLAFASLCSNYAYECADPQRTGSCRDPREVFRVSSARGFVREVRAALLAESEDGSSLLTDVLDAAEQLAIEDGSEFWITIGDEP